MVNQSKNKFTMKTKYGAAVAPVFVLAGAYVAWNYIGRRVWQKKDDNNGRDRKSNISKTIEERPRAVPRDLEPVNGTPQRPRDDTVKKVRRGRRGISRSVSLGTIRGGKLALQRLLDLHSYRSDTSSLANIETELEASLSKENPDFGLLQRDIVKMEMSGKEAKAVEILKKALQKAREEKRDHEAYEIEMLLVEMLIYMGNLEEALKCKCLEDEIITDARRPLYQSIIHYLRGDPIKQVEESFNKFREIQIGLQWPGSSEEDETQQITLDEFKKVMVSLRQDIEEETKNT